MNVRFKFVDGMRGFAAMAVVLYHAIEGNHITLLYDALPKAITIPLRYGNGGVAIFFVLSGFVIAHSLSKHALTVHGAVGFMLKRSIRLDPPYWASLALTISFAALAAAVVKGRPNNEYSAPQIVAHIFYLQDLLGFKEISPVFWTLCFEVQFYLVFALILVTGSNLVLIASFCLSLAWPLHILPEFTGVFLSLWYGFLLGVGAYLSQLHRFIAPYFLVYLGTIGVAGWYHSEIFPMICATTALLLFTVSLLGKLETFFNWRWIQFLGMISYSLYLIHNPITGATFRIGYMLTDRTLITEAIWWSFSIVASIAVATIFYYAVEKPSMRLSRMVRERKLS